MFIYAEKGDWHFESATAEIRFWKFITFFIHITTHWMVINLPQKKKKTS